jgi:hypothetical protein
MSTWALRTSVIFEPRLVMVLVGDISKTRSSDEKKKKRQYTASQVGLPQIDNTPSLSIDIFEAV